MLGFFKKLFGAEPVETPAPYKVEAPAPVAVPAVKKAVKKAVVKKATTRRPRAPKA
jgi:hypothetical protein